MTMDHEEFLTALAIELISIAMLTYVLSFRRHRRRDPPLGLIGGNVGLFVASSFTSTTSIGVGVGIGVADHPRVLRHAGWRTDVDVPCSPRSPGCREVVPSAPAGDANRHHGR